MSFNLTGRVALITGGASGIGLQCAKELLRNGLKAVTLADVNDQLGRSAFDQIRKEFGPNRALYVKTDVADKHQFENAFNVTVSTFTNLDILINNAGIMNDATWEKEIVTNVIGTTTGILLGLEKIPKHRTGPEGIIVNVSSIVGLDIAPNLPIYSGTKFAVQAMSRSFGAEVHYQRHKVRFLTLCPGVTMTPLVAEMGGRNLGPEYDEISRIGLTMLPQQETEFVGKALTRIINEGQTGSVWVAEGGEEPYEVEFPKRTEMKKKQ